LPGEDGLPPQFLRVKIKSRKNETESLEESFDKKKLLRRGIGDCLIPRCSTVQSRKLIAGQDVLRSEQNWRGEELENNPGLIAFTRNGACGGRWEGALLVTNLHEAEEGSKMLS
jgi:hypothetical protein